MDTKEDEKIIGDCTFLFIPLKLYASDKRHKGNLLVLAPSFLNDTQNGKKNDNTSLGQSQWCHMEPNSNAHKIEKIP